MFKGSLPALVTPFTPDGDLDLAALEKLVEWQIAQGSHGLVPVGTTGESPTLTHDEHRKVVEEVVRIAAGRDAKDVAFSTIFGPVQMVNMAPLIEEERQ